MFQVQGSKLKAVKHASRPGTLNCGQHEREESNPVKQLWRLPALPGAHSCKAAPSREARLGSQGIRRELNPYLLGHSQACSDRYTTDTMS